MAPRIPDRTYVQIFDVARTAHLERLVADKSVMLLYRRASYDFDAIPSVANRVRQTSLIRMAAAVASGRFSRLEVNEPLYFRSWPVLLTVVAADRLGRRIRGGERIIVFYAIDNGPVAEYLTSRTRLPASLITGLLRIVVKYVSGATYRIAFGTAAARQNYQSHGLTRKKVGIEEFTALEPACECLRAIPVKTSTVVFLGRLDDRKGIRQLVECWPLVSEAAKGARLIIIGSGPLQSEVDSFAFKRNDVQVLGHLDHVTTHRYLRAAKVLCLPSQRVGAWREQIGLPIIEALSHGCEIVTSAETGIAGWLSDNAHFARQSPTTRDLSGAITRALASPDRTEAILRSLPSVGGRVQAHRWMTS